VIRGIDPGVRSIGGGGTAGGVRGVVSQKNRVPLMRLIPELRERVGEKKTFARLSGNGAKGELKRSGETSEGTVKSS